MENSERVSAASANQKLDDAEVILFARPASSIPLNPFASNEKLASPLSANDHAHDQRRNSPVKTFKNFLAFSDTEAESEIEFDKRNAITSTAQQPCSPPLPPTPLSNSPAPLPGSSSRKQSYYFAESEEEDQLDISKISESLNKGRQPTDNPALRRSSESFNVSIQNSTGVRLEDVTFSSIIFISHLLSFAVDFSLMCWYYLDEGANYNFKWCSALTFFILVSGSIGILQQFNQAEKDRLDRLFTHGRRVQILVNSFPPIGTILCSYYCTRSAWKAKMEQVFSVHFFAVEEFSQKLSRVQGFFQSAPQAALQLVILMETLDHITIGKGLLTFSSVILSLSVMTFSNLPGRHDMVETSVRKGYYSPVSRVFLGIRMISSFASRAMGIAYFLMGIRCILGTASTALSVIFGISAIVIPRFVFTLIDYCYHCHRVRMGRESSIGQFGRLSFCGTCTGYMATIFFPMSHPLWVFWFIWVETLIFITWGFISSISTATESPACVSSLVNFLYTAAFTIVFIVIPFLLPYARATVKRKRSNRVARMFEERDRDVTNLQQNVTASV